MKNLFNAIKKSGPLRTRSQKVVSAEQVDFFDALTLHDLMDLLNTVKAQRIAQLPINLGRDCIVHMDLKLYENARLGDELHIESSFVPTKHKKRVDLKIYVSKRTGTAPAVRVCRASYTISIQPIVAMAI